MTNGVSVRAAKNTPRRGGNCNQFVDRTIGVPSLVCAIKGGVKGSSVDPLYK